MRKRFRRRFKPSALISPTQQILFLDTGTSDPEVEAAWQWLKNRFPAAHRIFPQQVPGHGRNHVLWWHETKPVVSDQWSAAGWKTLQRFLKTGGNLFLSLAAVQAVVPLGLEKEWPDISEAGNYDPNSRPAHEWIAPQGFEQRGLMGFLPHLPNHAPSPLSLYGGGIYLWNAKAGAPYWRFGYGANARPRGNVWGVHRYYLGFDPAQKFAWTYDEPHVLCVGAYLYFSDSQNAFRPQLEFFTEACLRHLSEKSKAGKKHNAPTMFWAPAVAEIRKNNRLLAFPHCESWVPIKWLEVSPHLIVERGRNNFFDLSGERILLMGNERGPITEIWSHPLRLCRNVSFRIKNPAQETLWDNGAESEVLIRPHQIERRRQSGRVAITERIWVGHATPLACIEWEFDGHDELYCELSFEVDFRLMWPYPEGALSKLEYQTSERRGRLSIGQAHFADHRQLFRAHFALAFEREIRARSRWQSEGWFEAPPIATGVENISERNISRARVTFHWRLDVKGKSAARFVALGGEANDSSLPELLNAFPEQLPKYYHDQAWRKYHLLEKFAEVDTPNPHFNAATRWAKIKTDAFVGHVPALGRAVFAGFANTIEGWHSGRPGYSWFFGRDACWTAFAMLHYGDFETVKEVLRFLGQHQDVNGKIFHELTTSGAAHYDAADATPLYIILMGRYLNHSGDLTFVKREWQHMEKAMAFLLSTDSARRNGLIENTGVGHGWIEGGRLFGKHVEHYLAGCWAEALRTATHLALALGKNDLAERWMIHQQKAHNLLEQDFWNEAAGYFYHGKNTDGSFDANVTALAAVPLLFGYGKPEDGVQALRRLATKAFNADWGVRLIADDDPFYDPGDDHTGRVSPLLTGWTALAEFRYGRWLQGVAHTLNALCRNYHGAVGCMPEALRSEAYRPAGVCLHQAVSESILLQSIYEGLLGVKTHALEHRLEFAPYLLLQWSFFSINALRLGDQQIFFYQQREANLFTFQFRARPFPGKIHKEAWPPVHIDFKPILPASAQLEVMQRDEHVVITKPEERANLVRWPISFELGADVVNVTLRFAKFFTAVPSFTEVKPGERSRGWMILEQQFRGKTVWLEVEGEPGTLATLEFVACGYEIRNIRGGRLARRDGERGWLDFEFPNLSHSGIGSGNSGRYARHHLEITLG